MRAKRSFYNLITAVGAQLLILLLGLLVPRLTLVNYGSEVNGFMTLVVQLYGYIGLMEAGLGTSEWQALYGPVAANDRRTISCVVNTAHRHFQKLTLYYAGVVVAVSLLLPLLVDSALPFGVMCAYFLLFGASYVVNFWFVAAMRPLLQVEGKNYVNTAISFVFSVGSTLAKIVMLSAGMDLLTLQVVYCGINVAQVLVYFLYFRMRYQWLDRSVPPEEHRLQQRGAFFWQQLCQLIFTCTDTFLISVFCDLKAGSVYAVYMLAYNAINQLVYLVVSSTQFVLGQIWHQERARYLKVHQAYEAGLMAVACTLYATMYVLLLPFVELYTAGVTDVDYYDAALPLLICLSGFLGTCKYVPLTLVNVACHARQTMKQTLGEAALNLGISVALIPVCGVRGALAGTCAAQLFRVVAGARYTNRKLLKTASGFSVRLYLSNLALFAAVFLVRQQMTVTLTSYGQFFLAGCVTVLVMGILFGGMNLAVNHSLLMPYVKWGLSTIIRRK